MASPLRITQHGEPHAHIMLWLGFYKAFTPYLQLGDNCTVRLDIDNEPQPDALLRIDRNKTKSYPIEEILKILGNEMFKNRFSSF